MRTLWLLLSMISSVAGCGGGVRQFPLEEPLWRDPDRRPFEGEPEEYFSPFAWDAANQTIFRPISRFFAVDPVREAVNVNAVDEVASSSWFRNRIGLFAMTPEQVAIGPCDPPRTDPVAPWLVTGAKPNGANPGFMIEDSAGKRYLVKFDGTVQGPRATAADVIVSKLYYAAGYSVPCNDIVFFRRDILRIDPEATGETASGDEEPLTERHLDVIFGKALRLPDGRYRASVSLFLEGKPIGPFTYQGTRSDDPNDVIPHEDRRELRGMRVLAAWTNHFDSREQNTLATWVETEHGRGYVRHNVIDFGDCFGSIWEPPMLGRRIGHSYYFDAGHILEDFVTLGTLERPWDEARFGRSGTVFGYYDVRSFEPHQWRPGYPNPAFSRMSERDAAWMTRIISRMTDAHLKRLVEVGRFGSNLLETELLRILKGRRRAILERYFNQLSPLSRPAIDTASARAKLCVTDFAVDSGVVARSARSYGARGWAGKGLKPARVAGIESHGPRVCIVLPTLEGASSSAPKYLIVDVTTRSGQRPILPLRVHLYQVGVNDYRVVGLERPYDSSPPG